MVSSFRGCKHYLSPRKTTNMADNYTRLQDVRRMLEELERVRPLRYRADYLPYFEGLKERAIDITLDIFKGDDPQGREAAELLYAQLLRLQ